jgi:tyrosine phenol-lyase
MPYAETFRIKVVQNIKPVPLQVRAQKLREASFNVYSLPHSAVYIDVVSCKGLQSMSDQQWAGLMVGDEAYAGSKNFYNLEDAVKQIFGKQYVVPTHMGRGSENLIFRNLLSPEKPVILSNRVDTAKPIIEKLGGVVKDCTTPDILEPDKKNLFKGNVDLNILKKEISKNKGKISGILLTCSVSLLGGQVMDIDNLKEVSGLAKEAEIPVILDISQVASASYFIKEARKIDRSVRDLVLEYTSCADIIYMSAREDAFCHTGGLIALNDEKNYHIFTALVVVFEGLHTYGGQAGRDMESFARGIYEMVEEGYHHFRRRKFDYIERKLKEAGLKLYYPSGTNGILIDSTPYIKERQGKIYRSETLAAYIYLTSGVRFAPLGNLVQPDKKIDMLGMMIPRRTYTERQIDFIIEAAKSIGDISIDSLSLREDITFECSEFAVFEDIKNQLTDISVQREFKAKPEPYSIKVVEPLIVKDRKRREEAMVEAGYNTFLLKSEDVYIDMLTDSGTSAMSSEQWAGVMSSVESTSGTDAYELFVSNFRDIMGFEYVLPTHQGRAAEHILSQCSIEKGQYIVNNMYFTTTREHQEMAGGIFVDLIKDEAHDTQSDHPFKGDIDPVKLEDFIKKVGREKIAYICLETNVNMAGGQPVSMKGTKKISEICKKHEIPLYFDATRCAENAYFIKWKEEGYQDWSIRDILKKLMSMGDGCTVSAKKDVLVNIGGILAVNDYDKYKKMANMGCVFEGAPRQGGLASRDLMCMALGLPEMVDEDYIRNRVQQVQYLGEKLQELGIPIVLPPGGHAIFLDAKRFLEHIPQEEFPAQRLAAEIYIESGVRTMERGNVSSGRDKVTGKNKCPQLELVRITVPRRVYTYSHMDIIAEGIKKVYDRRKTIKGLEFTYEPPTLRFFTSRFKSL